MPQDCRRNARFSPNFALLVVSVNTPKVPDSFILTVRGFFFFFLKEPPVVCVMIRTSMSVSFCDWVTISEKNTFKGKSSHFWLVPSWGMPPLLIILGPMPSSVGVSVGSKDICYESSGQLVFRADLTAGLQMEMRRFVSIIFTLLSQCELVQKIESLCTTNGQNSGEQRSGFHRVKQSREEN